jgi:hypothetical protein
MAQLGTAEAAEKKALKKTLDKGEGFGETL